MKVTIKEIAKKSGFGVGTVSRALSAKPFLVKEETRKKILAIAEECGYIKDVSAQALVKGKTNDVGFVLPAMFGSAFYNDFSIRLISSMLKALAEHDCKLRVLFLKEKAGFTDMMKEIMSLKLRGLIICPYFQNFYISEQDIRKLGIPIVVLSKHLHGENIRSVILDDFKGGYDGTKYLIDLGHKKIGILRSFNKDIEARFEGYMKAMADNGLPIDDKFILRGDGQESTGFEMMNRLLKREDVPTAVFSLNDEMGIGAINAIRAKGLRCPEDISLFANI